MLRTTRDSGDRTDTSTSCQTGAAVTQRDTGRAMSQENVEEPRPEWPWPATLQSLARRETSMFALLRSSPPEFWLLEQGGKPVGMIKRADEGTRLRTVSEEWRMGVTRRKRLGWQLVFARPGKRETALCYSPSTLLQRGRLDVSGGRRYTLRSPLLRTDWRLLAATGDEVARIAFRGHRPTPTDLKKHVNLSTEAADEPLLPIVILAASAAILVHQQLPHGYQGPGI
jgi:hypothetical protein